MNLLQFWDPTRELVLVFKTISDPTRLGSVGEIRMDAEQVRIKTQLTDFCSEPRRLRAVSRNWSRGEGLCITIRSSRLLMNPLNQPPSTSVKNDFIACHERLSAFSLYAAPRELSLPARLSVKECTAPE